MTCNCEKRGDTQLQPHQNGYNDWNSNQFVTVKAAPQAPNTGFGRDQLACTPQLGRRKKVFSKNIGYHYSQKKVRKIEVAPERLGSPN
jgi:hypothetical protein